MTEPTERQPLPDLPETDETSDLIVDVYPSPDEPRSIPQSIAIDRAITVAAGRFDEVSELDVLTPEKGGDASSAHRLLLVLLDNSSIEHTTIAQELDYRSEAELLGAIRLARNAVGASLK